MYDFVLSVEYSVNPGAKSCVVQEVTCTVQKSALIGSSRINPFLSRLWHISTQVLKSLSKTRSLVFLLRQNSCNCRQMASVDETTSSTLNPSRSVVCCTCPKSELVSPCCASVDQVNMLYRKRRSFASRPLANRLGWRLLASQRLSGPRPSTSNAVY